MFLFPGLEVEIDLNPFCFFVPVFNAKVQDLISANVDNVEYEVYRAYMSELLGIKKFQTNCKANSKMSNVSRINVDQHLRKVIESTGFGNCLFDAVSYLMFGNFLHGLEIRKKTVMFMQQNINDYKELINISNMMNEEYNGVDADDEAIAKYLRKMSISGVWGGTPELKAMSNYFNLPLEVYNADWTHFISFNTQLEGKPLYLQFINGNHYNPIIISASKISFNGVEFSSSDIFNFKNLENLTVDSMYKLLTLAEDNKILNFDTIVTDIDSVYKYFDKISKEDLLSLAKKRNKLAANYLDISNFSSARFDEVINSKLFLSNFFDGYGNLSINNEN